MLKNHLVSIHEKEMVVRGSGTRLDATEPVSEWNSQKRTLNDVGGGDVSLDFM